MATVSGNFGFTLTAALLTAVLALGCSGVAPVKPQAKWQTEDIDAIASKRSPIAVSAVSADATLPQQQYNAAGEKIAYIPQPNPYLDEAGSVPDEARSIFTVASTRLQQGDFDGAKAKFTLLTEKYPSLSGPWVKLGEIAEAQERYPEAIKHFEKAISVNRNNVNAYMALGLAQRKQGYFSEAFNTYLDALAVWRDFPEAHLNLGILYDLYLNNPEEAQKHYEAYHFLTGEKNENVRKWLVEVKHRTGIDQSFIDSPPVKVTGTTATGTGDAIAVAITDGKN
jgi:tetratricopeptide (TPR) repeat protein